MRIEMTADFRVAADGFTVELWTAGSVHEVTEQLAKDLIAADKARLARETPRVGRPPKAAQAA